MIAQPLILCVIFEVEPFVNPEYPSFHFINVFKT